MQMGCFGVLKLCFMLNKACHMELLILEKSFAQLFMVMFLEAGHM